MAGLGEVCSHAAALMYTVLAAVDKREGQTCTEKPCTWTKPRTKKVKYDELSHLCLPRASCNSRPFAAQHHLLMSSSSSVHSFTKVKAKRQSPRKVPSVTEGHSLRYMPKTVLLDLPTPLTTLDASTRLEMDLPALLEEGAKIFEELHLTPEQKKEDTARESYLMAMQDLHADLNVAASGFTINPKLPWIGASTDVVTCACHEPGVLEIKCPFSAKDRTLHECVKDSQFCLTVTEEGVLSLKLDHRYVYQVQAQMHVAEVTFCDFVVWTPQ
ncbi:hypothetical protein DPX16_6394 [Anabarilius grahami]|uniref:YqaJ viral recombinase domain-containing protein n=1 Tax=Anabarilius grahami TaxID=495550 RepID=A0A3N0XGA2_ANAGA|nr:hypothetical protein DPX16_6394 [Anabarilius grahami]